MIALVVKQSAVLTVVGIVLGSSGAAMLSRYLEGLLFGLTPLDPATFVAAAVLFMLVALVGGLRAGAARDRRRSVGGAAGGMTGSAKPTHVGRVLV